MTVVGPMPKRETTEISSVILPFKILYNIYRYKSCGLCQQEFPGDPCNKANDSCVDSNSVCFGYSLAKTKGSKLQTFNA